MIAGILRALSRLLFRVRVSGLEHAPLHRKILVIANHESFLDGLLVGLFLPFNATFVVHTTVLKNPLFRLILSLVNYLAVDPTSPLAMKQVVKLLNAGQPVVIFPEGRITLTGSLMKVYDGPAFVAAKTGATLLPVRIEGASHSYFSRLKDGHPRKWFPKVSISMLPPTLIEMPNEPTAKLRRRMAGEAMRRIMQEMLFVSKHTNTLFEALLDAADLHGKNTLMVEDMQQTEESYADLIKKSLALGRLVSKITKIDENVGVLMPNVTNTVCLIYGMTAMQRVPAMINYTAGTEGMRNACIVAGIKVIITSKTFLATAKLTETVAKIPDVDLVYLEDLKQFFTLPDKLWLVLFAIRFPRFAQINQNADKPAVVLFTSGSEGKPKGVVHSHRAIMSNVAQIRAVIDFSPLDKFMMVLPLFHAFGFTAGAILPLVCGTKVFIYPSPLHYKVIPEVIYDRGCTVLFGTSTFLGNYAKYANPYDFYKLRYVVAGAEKLNDEVRKLWVDKFGIRILEGYGSTECAPVLAVNTPMAALHGSVGNLLPGIHHRLIPIPGITNGGQLIVKGPNIMLGYYLYDNPAMLKPPSHDFGSGEEPGWYNTGDIVEIDRNHFVHIRGRVKRFAKVAGEMVSLETVESIANKTSNTHQHAATTQPDAQRGENIVLFTTDFNLDRESLIKTAKTEGQPEIAVPRKIMIVDELPLLGTGKIDYVKLKLIAESAS